MPFLISIGNPVPSIGSESPLDVDVAEVNIQGESNSYSVSYHDWDPFVAGSNLQGLFKGEWSDLFTGDPFYRPLNKGHHMVIHKALERCKNQPSRRLLFGESNYEFFLELLTWFEFWVGWSLENCDNPIIKVC